MTKFFSLLWMLLISICHQADMEGNSQYPGLIIFSLLVDDPETDLSGAENVACQLLRESHQNNRII